MRRNRIRFKSDLIFSIVQMPLNWNPSSVFDVPMTGMLVSKMRVASYEEARDDLIRCNQLALKQGLREWAVIQMDKSEN